jgi:CHAT domain-containing protein
MRSNVIATCATLLLIQTCSAIGHCPYSSYEEVQQLRSRPVDPARLKVLKETVFRAEESLYHQNNYSQAKLLFSEALEMVQITGNHAEAMYLAGAYYRLGQLLHLVDNDHRQAETYYRAASECNTLMDKGDMYWQMVTKYEMRAEILQSLTALYIEDKRINEAYSALSSALNFDENAFEQRMEVGFHTLPAERYTGLPNFEITSLWIDTVLAANLLELAPTDKRLIELAWLTALRSKGRAFDVYRQTIKALRRQFPKQFRDYSDYMSILSQIDLRAFLKGPYDEIFDEVKKSQAGAQESRVDMDDVLRRLDPYKSDVGNKAGFSVSGLTQKIANAMPEKSVLVEVVRYIRYTQNAKERLPDLWKEPCYVAFILRPGRSLSAVQIGKADEVDDLVSLLRESIADDVIPIKEIKDVAHRLWRRVFEPFRSYLNGVNTIFFAGDGVLDLLPVSALVDNSNHFIVESYKISYLSSAREFLRMRTRPPPQSPAFIVGKPHFGKLDNPAQGARASLVFDEDDISETLSEATAMAALIPQALLATGDAARESAVKRLRGPAVLHLATHGFYIPSPLGHKIKGRYSGSLLHPWTETRKRVDGDQLAWAVTELYDPSSRVGIALADANQWARTVGEDGILTAKELNTVDLNGTQIAVLSACDTGVGDVDGAEGLISLRSALEIAGSQTQVISLFSVNDPATSRLMTKFYTKLLDGAGTAEALRRAQLELLTDGVHTNPYFWAAFSHWGSWSPISMR